MYRHWLKFFLLTILLVVMVATASAGAAPAPSAAAPGTGILLEPEGVTGPGIYIVQLAEAPVASYRGSIAGLAPTNPEALGAVQLDASSAASRAYERYLESRQADMLAAVEGITGAAATPKFAYQHAFNGFAIELTPDQARAVANLPGVRQVQRDFEYQIHTDAGPQWIGAPGIWTGNDTGGKPGTMGEGVIVGVLDTGINPDHPSFADVGDDGYDHDNPYGAGNYVGLCASDPANWQCNDKLIGYYIYTGETTEDTNGHGSHTASTAAGNWLNATTAILDAPTYDYAANVSGVAPHANIIMYDVCLDAGGCASSGSVAAINQAVVDGVDVINFSIGGPSSNPWNDSTALAFLGAFEAGVIPVTSAGNSGPGPGTIGSPADAPWMLAVGASTHNRAFRDGLVNMSGGSNPPDPIEGAGLTSGYGPAPIVHAGDFGDAMCLNEFPAGTWNGQIVVCDRGINARMAKGYNVLQGGAGGMVLANSAADGEGVVADPHHLPAVHIGFSDGEAVRNWLESGSGHRARITGAVVNFDAANGDITAGFSSRGPAPSVPSVIKPDVTNPGVSIFAAVQSGISDPIVSPLDEFGLISGTSMSSPHTAGSAALLRALHPNWTPAMVRSALMSTGKVVDVFKEDGVAQADPFDIGGGRVQLREAGEVGLLMHVNANQYEQANPANGGDPRKLNLPSMADNDCQGRCGWRRTVINATGRVQTWNVSLRLASGMRGVVNPSGFTLAPGATQVLEIGVDVSRAPLDEWIFGTIILKSAGGNLPVQHMPIAVMPTLPDADIVVGPQGIDVSLPADSTTTEELTIGNVGGSDLTWSIFEDDAGSAVNLEEWADNFDSYDTGISLHGVGGWKGWDQSAAATAFTSDDQSRSAPNSVDIEGPSDLVHQYSGSNAGFWTYTAWQFIPNDFDGESYFIMLNKYRDFINPKSWAVQVTFSSLTDQVVNTGLSGGVLPLITGRWVELRVEIDLVNDKQAFFYDGDLLYEGTWTDENSQNGPLDIAAVDLFANGATSVYYDDLSLDRVPPPACALVDDIPWASVSPAAGTTPGGSSDTVDVTFDSAGLAPGAHVGRLCVDSNDPDEAQIIVPIRLTVEE